MARSHRSGGSSRSSLSSSRSSFGSRSSFSSSRSHHSSFGSSRMQHHRPSMHHLPPPSHGGVHYHSHGPIVLKGSSALAAISCFIIFIALFVSIFLSSQASSTSNILSEIENSYHHYQNMITYAQKNPDYQVTAKITDIALDTMYDKYYIEYTVYSPNSYGFNVIKIREESFAMYSYEEMLNLNIGDNIQIATNNRNIDHVTDSINMDYQNVSLEEDAEYKFYKSEYKVQKTASTISKIAIPVFIVIAIVAAIKAKKKKKSENETSTTTDTTSTNQPTNTTTTQSKYCAYCGAQLTSEQTKCPLCGAIQRKF